MANRRKDGAVYRPPIDRYGIFTDPVVVRQRRVLRIGGRSVTTARTCILEPKKAALIITGQELGLSRPGPAPPTA